MKPLTYGSVCSGIEAATCAWHPLGFKPAFFSEIESFPSAVLSHHYPSTPNLGDMTKFKDWPDYAIRILVGGTPCQSFSVAGLRKGLADPRGNLMLTFGAIAARYRPQWLVWENVPGVLSSEGGRDFACFLGLITGQRVEVPAEGWQNSGIVSGIASAYGVAYRVLDAQHVRTHEHHRAVPQRRRRVFVVGYLGDWRRAAAVLLERESLSGNPPPGRSARQGPAPTLSARTKGGGGLGTDFDLDGGLDEAAVTPDLLCAGTGQAGTEVLRNLCPTLNCNHEQPYVANVTGTLAVSGGHAVPGTCAQDAGEGFLVAHALRAEGFDASEDGTGRGTGRGTPIVPVVFQGKASSSQSMNPGEVAPSLDVGKSDGLCVAFSCKGHAGSHANGGGQVAVAYSIQDGRDIAKDQNGLGINPDGSAYTVDTTGAQAVALQERGREGGRSLEIGGDVAFALTAPSGGGRAQERNIATTTAVRRLTPRECERLMGLPDGYTDIVYRGKKAADGPRYKALGNSFAANCLRWIGERIQQVDAI